MFALARRGGWAGSADAAAAIARIARVSSSQTTVPWHVSDLAALLYHRSSLVRINAALAVAACRHALVTKQSPVLAGLGLMVRNDSSVAARHVAAATLGQLAGDDNAAALGTAVADLQSAMAQAKDRPLADLARQALLGISPAAAVARDEWRIFYVVDPSADDAPARQEPYFLVGADGLVWATYTDARGDITTEHFPAGDATILSSTRQSEY